MHKVFCYITIYLQGCTKITLGTDCWSAITWWSGRFENSFGRREVANILVADIHTVYIYIYIYAYRTTQPTRSTSFAGTNQIMMCRGTVGVCCEDSKKHVNRLCGGIHSVWVLNAAVVTTGLLKMLNIWSTKPPYWTFWSFAIAFVENSNTISLGFFEVIYLVTTSNVISLVMIAV